MAAYPPIVSPGDALPDGAYIGLADEIYFAQPRLGSSDLIKLNQQGRGWWWSSRYNPDKGNTTTDAMNYGSALHALMLEGLAAYESRFAVEPDPKDPKFRRILYKVDDYKAALKDAGFDLKGTSGWKAPDWLAECAVSLPADVVAWDNVLADFEKSISTFDAEGNLVSKKPVVSAVENRMLRVMYRAAVEAEGPQGDDLRSLLGIDLKVPALAELSFLWTDRFGVRRRARFDKPVPTLTLDLKSLGNWQGRQLVHGIADHILRGGLDVQVGDQHVARILMHRMIAERGEAAIHGGTPEERAWLRAIAERNLPFRWAWLFYQKPDASAGRAPVIFPLFERWAGPFHTSGHRKAFRAIETYLDGVEKFGLDRPWTEVRPPHYVDEHEARNAGVKPISLPHFGWDEDPVEGEDVDLNPEADQ